jgi:hypothetical protein
MDKKIKKTLYPKSNDNIIFNSMNLSHDPVFDPTNGWLLIHHKTPVKTIVLNQTVDLESNVIQQL